MSLGQRQCKMQDILKEFAECILVVQSITFHIALVEIWLKDLILFLLFCLTNIRLQFGQVFLLPKCHIKLTAELSARNLQTGGQWCVAQ